MRKKLPPFRSKDSKVSPMSPPMSESLEKVYDAWRKNSLEPTLAKVGERCPEFSTSSNIDLKRCYFPTKQQERSSHYNSSVGFPGEFPFTRGIHPTMYRSRLWTMRQYAGFGTAIEANHRYRYLLSQGTTGLSIAFDLPTQMGRDSDDPRALGEVGRVGVAVDSLSDMDVLFESIPLDKISTSMTINATACILLALYLELAKKRNISWDKLRGTVQNDILKEYIARGTYIYPPRSALKMVTDLFEFCSDKVPQWNTISISGYHIREAGSNAVQEIAFTLADAITYVESALKKGLDVDSFAPRLTFFFGCHNNFLEEVAKFRAARRMWAKIMRERFGTKNPRSCMLRFHTQTCGSSLTASQPEVNIVRTTIQAMAAVFGGTQSLHTNAYDEAQCLPTEASAALALRTQQVIGFESGVGDTVDPFGGSYCIEQLTDSIEKRANDYLEKIDSLGGMLSAIEGGYPQNEIEESAYHYQKEIEQGDRTIVGVNEFMEDVSINQQGPNKGFTSLDATGKAKITGLSAEASQIKSLQAVRSSRDSAATKQALCEVESVARQGSNIMPAVCKAVSRYATVGEISDSLRKVYGEHD